MFSMQEPYLLIFSGLWRREKYYHTDHLGSATLITDDAADVVQQIAYLPYGEDWVDVRHHGYFGSAYKFNGKEKDDETGYSYYGARCYTDRLSIWLSVDPLADKYPHLSPYAYCADNPVKYIDPDGMKIVGTDGKPVTFSPDKGWSSNAPKDVIKVGNAMMRTKTGTKVLNDMFNAKYDISISIQQKSEGSPPKHGITKTRSENGVIQSADIILYEETMSQTVDMYKNISGREDILKRIVPQIKFTEKQKKYLELTPTLEDMYTTVGTHEGTHASDPTANSTFVSRQAAEKKAEKIEMKATQELIDDK